jgi:hypothetical protein
MIGYARLVFPSPEALLQVIRYSETRPHQPQAFSCISGFINLIVWSDR